VSGNRLHTSVFHIVTPAGNKDAHEFEKPDKQCTTHFNQPLMVWIESPHAILRVSRGRGTAEIPGQLPLVFGSIGS
jgi:hypothetical protein